MESIEEYDIRIKKAAELKAKGLTPYAKTTGRTHRCSEAIDHFDELASVQNNITLAGRVRSIRRHGGSTFLVIEDASASLQIFLSRTILGESYEIVKEYLDMGDFIECTGYLMRTKTEEMTLSSSRLEILVKALRPLPDQWHGLSDTEMRYRHRELDLIANPDARTRFVVRSKLVSSLRKFLDTRDFIEVETPVLQAIPGGANARPFVTHHHALNVDFYLRIAPELYLKRLIVGGFEKVYEIGKLFRNEGIDHAHSPEFTSLELYWAFVPGKDFFVHFLEELLREIIHSSVGTLHVASDGAELDFASPWPKMTFREAIIYQTGIDIDKCRDTVSLLEAVKQAGLSIDFTHCVGMGEHYDQLFKKTARDAIVQPTWIFDYPLELKPLANVSDDDPTKSASVQLIIQGAEIINAYYHEQNNPLEQRARFMEQEALREAGSTDAQYLDEDFLLALEHGMPPTCGMGMGIDRLAMLLTNQQNLKEVILFPTLRPSRPLAQ